MLAHAAAVIGEAAAFDLVVRERSLQVLVQRPKRAVVVDFGKFGVVINDVPSQMTVRTPLVLARCRTASSSGVSASR